MYEYPVKLVFSDAFLRGPSREGLWFQIAQNTFGEKA